MSDEHIEKQRAINWLVRQLAFERMLDAYRCQALGIQPVKLEPRRDRQEKAA